MLQITLKGKYWIPPSCQTSRYVQTLICFKLRMKKKEKEFRSKGVFAPYLLWQCRYDQANLSWSHFSSAREHVTGHMKVTLAFLTPFCLPHHWPLFPLLFIWIKTRKWKEKERSLEHDEEALLSSVITPPPTVSWMILGKSWALCMDTKAPPKTLLAC